MSLVGSPHGEMAKELDCGPEVSDFELWSSYIVQSRTNTFEKGMNLIVSLLHFFFFTKMALALNKPWSFICHKNKKTN